MTHHCSEVGGGGVLVITDCRWICSCQKNPQHTDQMNKCSRKLTQIMQNSGGGTHSGGQLWRHWLNLPPMHYAAIHWNRRERKFLKVNGRIFLIFQQNQVFFFVLVKNCKYFARKIMFTRQWCKILDIFAKKNLKGVTVRVEILYTCRWTHYLKKEQNIIFFSLAPFIVKM